MIEFFSRLLDTTDFSARWSCGHWTAGHGWLHILSDLGVWSAYVAIPCVLISFLLRRRDLPFRFTFLLFGAFILLCGTTHLMEAIIFWWPAYRLAGVIKLATAIVSWATVIALVPLVPKVLAMRSPAELEREMTAREQAENELQRLNAELELRVEQRTSELKLATTHLQEEREQLRVALASIGDAVLTADGQGLVTFQNDVAAALTGWSTEDAVGQPVNEVFHIVNEFSGQLVESPVDRVLREGVIVGLANHTVLIAKDGTRRPIEDSGSPIRLRGEIAGVVLVFRDVTERRKAERELRENEARKTAILETSLDAIVSINHRGEIVEFNPAAERIFGYEKANVLGQPMAELIIPPAYREAHHQGFACYLATGVGPVLNQRLELSALRSDGSEFPLELTVTRIPVEGPPLFTAYLRDITEARRVAEQLREQERQFRTLAESIPQLAWMANPDGHIFWYNRRWYDYTGTTLEQMAGWGWQSVHDPEVLPSVLARWRGSIATGQPFDMVFPLRKADGELRQFLTRVEPIKDRAGQVVRWFGTNTDITEQRQMANELRQLAANLSEADRRKDEFLATLAHELRNPLAPISNGLQVLKIAGGVDSDLEPTRAMMERQIAQMVRLVDDLLDVSRITRNKLELRKERVELAAVINSAVETSRPLIDANGHQLTVTTPPAPIWIDADLTRLAQVLSNLLNNAAKYTDRGGHIWLTAERESAEIVISVRDTGMGIPAAMLPKIFEMFMQVDRTLERSQGGLGIGLTLVRRLIEMHGGTVEARSDGTDHGSEFVVRLPVLSVPDDNAQAASPETNAALVPVARRRILVADDNADSATSLGLMLKFMGNETRTANDGLEAVETAEQFRPDVILLDIGMPKLNGYEACRRIREQSWGAKTIIIALTGWGQDEDKRRSQEAGFDHHLVKPVDVSALEKLIAGL